MNDTTEKDPAVEAAKMMDWQQVVLNGGPPCFHLGHDGVRFCGRAERWEGHSDVKQAYPYHKFVSLADLLASRPHPAAGKGTGKIESDEISKLLKAAAHALRSYQFGNSSPDLAKEVADLIEGQLR